MRKPAHRIFLYIMQLAFLAIIVGSVANGVSGQAGWLGLMGLVLTFAPGILQRAGKLALPFYCEVIFVLYIFFSVVAGESFDLYSRFWWWDDILHFTSGLIVGYVAILVLYANDRRKRVQTGYWFASIYTIALVCMSAVVWEIFEYMVDKYAHGNMQHGLGDTMHDMMNAGLGSVIMAVAAFRYFKYRPQKGRLARQLEAFMRLNY